MLADEIASLRGEMGRLRDELSGMRTVESGLEHALVAIEQIRARSDDAQLSARVMFDELRDRLDRLEDALAEGRREQASEGVRLRAAGDEIARAQATTSRLERRLALHIEETEKTGRALLERIEVARLALLRSVGPSGGPS